MSETGSRLAGGWVTPGSGPWLGRRPAGAVLYLVLLGLVVVGGCASLTEPLSYPWKTPEVALAGLRVKELSLARQSFVVRLAVHNPNDRALPITAMTWRLQIEGRDLAEGTAKVDRQVPAFGDALVDLEAEGSLVARDGRPGGSAGAVFDLLGLTEQAAILTLQEGSVTWKVSGTLTLAGSLFPLPYWYSGQVDAKTLAGLRAWR